MKTPTTTTRRKAVRRKREHIEPCLSFGPGKDLVRMEQYGTYDMLELWLPMLRSVNRKFAVAGSRLYITKEYRDEEEHVVEGIQAMVRHVGWKVAPHDRYLIAYRFSFKVPASEKQRAGDIHNPLKPFSDCLVAGGAIYDDDKSRLELVSKLNTRDKDHWAQIFILRFPEQGEHFLATLFEELLLDIPSLLPKRKTA